MATRASKPSSGWARAGHAMRILLLAFAAAPLTAAVWFTRTEVRPNAQRSGRYKKLAVMPFQSQHAQGSAWAASFITELMGAGFSMVERTQLQSILEELKLNHTGLMSGDKVKQLGRVADIDGLVVGSVDATPTGEIRSVSLRIVDVETADVILSSTFSNGDHPKDYVPFNRIPSIMVSDIGPKLTEARSLPPKTVLRSEVAPMSAVNVLWIRKTDGNKGWVYASQIKSVD